MESYTDRSRIARNPTSPAVRWVREWVPQEVVATGRRCYLLKWVTEDKLYALREKYKEDVPVEQKPEPSTEILFLCTFDQCGKTFAEAGALRKHTHIHGERQYVCPVEGCGKKFLDSSKLKRHNLIHTGEKSHCCPYEGCGKAFSLDFNLRAHMKTHSAENYHICPYPECGKKYTHECKLKSHIRTHHEKDAGVSMRPQQEKLQITSRVPLVNPTSSDRPYGCPFVGCEKAYLHEYKLNLHLRKEHPGYKLGNGGDPYAQTVKSSSISKNSKRGKSNLPRQMPPAKVAKRSDSSPTLIVSRDAWKRPPITEFDEDSEEIEEEEDYEEEEDAWMPPEMMKRLRMEIEELGVDGSGVCNHGRTSVQ